jgi:hypothetical protein
VNCDLPTSGETPVRAIRVTDECWVMGVVTDTAASERVCVAIDKVDSRKQRGDDRGTHPGVQGIDENVEDQRPEWMI